MFQFLNLNPEIFGIDINDLSIKLIKLKKKHKGFEIVSLNEVKIKPGVIKEGVIKDEDELARVIKQACASVKGKKLETKYVAVALPEEKSFSQVIQMPKMTEEELRLAVPFEAANYIPLPVDKVYVDFQPINAHQESSGHLDLLINVMPKTVIDSYVSCIKKAGLIPYILEVESQSIIRSLIKQGAPQEPLIVIDFGETKTSFIIFSGDFIKFTSSIPISSQQLTFAIAEALGISNQEAEALKIKNGLLETKKDKYNIKKIITPILKELAAQIQKYINFYHGHSFHEFAMADGKIEKIIISGGGSNLKKLPKFLSEELQMLVEIGNPTINILPQLKKQKHVISYEQSMSYTTALGLAIRGASSQEEKNHD